MINMMAKQLFKRPLRAFSTAVKDPHDNIPESIMELT